MTPFEVSGFDDLIDELTRLEEKPMDFPGKLHIETSQILSNLDVFNKKYHKRFKIDVSNEKLIDYFFEQYTEIFNESLLEDSDPKKIFNQRFRPYAKMKSR